MFRITKGVWVGAAVLAWAPTSWADEGSKHADKAPALDYGAPVLCYTTPDKKRVRVQCSGEGRDRKCLVAPSDDAQGDPLNKTRTCTFETPDSYVQYVAGSEVVNAAPETPPGYARSSSGRAYQVQFDLANRVFLGASWVPTFQLGDLDITAPEDMFGRGQAEFGIDISYLSVRNRSRHDIRIMDATATFPDLELRGLLFAYDYQQVHRRPAFYVTTFFGEPKLHEVAPPLGWGFRVLRVRDQPAALRSSLDMELAELHVSVSPWQSANMAQRFRLEAGIDTGKSWLNRTDLEKGLDTGDWYVGFDAAARLRLELGNSGLHYFNIDLDYRHPVYADGLLAGSASNDVSLKGVYEGIFVAINDQPLSFRVVAEGSSLEDPLSGIRHLEARTTLGMRVSFWAPPPVFDPLPALEDP
ncbi:MAG: hypothetical protein U0271_42835 [Polyangiaceae bacterium]